MTPADTKAPLPDEVKDAIYQFRQTAKEFGINDLDWFTSWKTIRAHIAAQAERIAELEAKIKNRGVCKSCKGRGRAYSPIEDKMEVCIVCNGTGKEIRNA